MNRLKFMRLNAKLSQRQLGEKSGVAASDVCKAESRGLRLYPVQAQRVAAALGWRGDPMELFEEVKDDADVHA